MPKHELPQGWLQIQLGDVVPYGKTQKCVLADVTDDTWVLELEDVEKESSRILSRKTAKERPFKSTKNRFEKGNVLYGKLRPYLNKVVVADSAGVCTTEIIPLDGEPFVLNRYLFHWLKTRDFLNYVNEVSYGVNMPRLGTKDGVAAPFVLAPLAEQTVIAYKLNTLLARAKNTKARLERMPQILKRFRQSVLAAAVSGQLTEEWRGYSQFNPENIILSEAIRSAQVGLVRSSKEQQSSPSELHATPYVKMNNIDNNWGTSLNHLVYVDCEEAELHKYQLKSADWLFNTRNSSELVGKSCVWKKSGEHLYNNNILRVRLLDGYFTEYLEIWCRSPEGRASLEKIKSATTSVAAIYQKQLLKQTVPFPAVEEQTQIVRRVDQLFAHADRIEQQVNNALARVNNLTQSILAKAFRGELTEQWRKDNPELISGENSAEALLEKIKAERAAMKPANKTRKRAPA